jgi:hypothetical protein
LHWRAAARAGKAAHTEDKSVTRAVFHAPMFALNAAAEANACEPKPPAVDADITRSHVSARMRGRPNRTRTHARARTQRARACAAGPHRRSVRPCSETHGCSYMHALGIHTLRMCVFHRWMALRRERVALAHMPRISASSAPARDRTRMQEHTRVPIYIPERCVDIYIYIHIYCT